MEAIREEEYVTLQVHDAQLGRIEELVEHGLARQEAIASDIKGEIKELHGEIKALDTKIDGVEKKLDAKIEGLEQKMDARFEHLEDAIAMTNSRINDLNNKKSNNVALWAIFTAVAGVFLTTVFGVYQLFMR